MDKLSFEILRILKMYYNQIRPNTIYLSNGIDKKLSARQFYTDNLDQTLFEAMSNKVEKEYKQGSGNELKDKMRSLRSSSAMTYNILGNGEVEISGDTYINQFEWKNKTLKSSSTPANLDALLVSKNKKVIACEMKMMEWIPSKTSKIKGVYLLEENYINKKRAKFL